MENLAIYFLKTNGVLTLFFGIYFLFLRNDTFFTIKRHFLLLGIFASYLIPFVTFTNTNYLPPVSKSTTIYQSEAKNPDTNIPEFTTTKIKNPITIKKEQPPIHWLPIAIYLYIGITILLGIRCIYQLKNVHILIQSHPKIQRKGNTYISTANTISPFSFFRHIVYNPTLHTPEELAMILRHEETHAQQLHSIDVMIAHLMNILLWCNPFAWSYKKQILQNLEFIADENAMNSYENKKQYQLTMLQVASTNYSSITTNFYQSFIKKRIIMLNTQKTHKRALWKLTILAPALAFFMWSFNTQEKIEYRVTTPQPVKLIVLKPSPTGIENTLQIFEIGNTTTLQSMLQFKKRLLNEFDTTLDIKTLKHHNGYISRIDLRFEDIHGNTGGITDTDNDSPVQHIQLVRETDQNGNIVEYKFHASHTMNSYLRIKQQTTTKEMLLSLGEKPAYMINGVIFPKKALIGKSFVSENHIQVIGSKTASKKYGDVAADGMILLYDALPYKSSNDLIAPNTSFIKTFYKRLGKEDIHSTIITILENRNKPEIAEAYYAKGDDNLIRATVYRLNEKLAVHGIPSVSTNSEKSPIIVVNNNITPYLKLAEYDFSSFSKITKIRSKKALKQYGRKATNGAIRITTE